MASEARGRRIRPTISDREFFPDWVGEILLQQDITGGPQFELDAGLDRARWFVVGINVELAVIGEENDCISVDAVDTSAFDIDPRSGGFAEILALANDQGSLPVTRIVLTGATLRDLLAHMTRGRIHLRAKGIEADVDVVGIHQQEVANSADTAS